MNQEPLAAIRGTRVALLIESDGPGGAERMVAELGRELTANGCEVVAFLPENGEGWLGRELERSGVIVDSFRLERPLSAACARRLAAAFRRHRIALAHGHEFTMTVYGAWAARLARVPHVSTMHGGRYYAARWRRRLALRLALDFSGAAVAVSAELAAHLRRDLWLADRRVAVVPNGVRAHAAPCPTLREELGIAADAPILLAVGNLYEVKGHRHLVHALALLASHSQAHLVVAGRGELAAALEERARTLGVAHRVHLLGLRRDVPALLAAATVFVQPSLAEGTPLALLEAMFAGRPIVASQVGEVGQVLADDAGVLVAPGDAAALAAALRGVLDDRAAAARLGRRAAERAARLYSLTAMVARYAGIYAALLGRGQA